MWKKKFFSQFLKFSYVYNFLNQCLPWVIFFTVVFLIYGLLGGLILAPADYQQGDGFRIIYVHVPAAFLSLLVYGFMGICAFVYVIWRIKLADLAAIAAAPLGASFTLIALITGSLWGKPMWGTWWVWDARLTSEMILLFIYLAVIALTATLDQASRATALMRNIFTLIGLINLPIIHYSVYWWNSLHQGATLTLAGSSHIAKPMLWPLLSMIFAFLGIFIWAWSLRLCNLIFLQLSYKYQNQKQS